MSITPLRDTEGASGISTGQGWQARETRLDVL